MLTQLQIDPARSAILTGFFEQYCALTLKEEQSLHQKSTRELTPEKVREIMEITTSWHEKGKQEGRLEGKLESRQEILILLAQKRFGVLPPSILENIKKLSIERLDILIERIFEVTSLDELSQEVTLGRN